MAYSVSITGGMLGLIDKTADGIISTLSVDNEQAIELDVVFGLGMVDIIAKAGSVNKTFKGFGKSRSLFCFTLLYHKNSQ